MQRFMHTDRTTNGLIITVRCALRCERHSCDRSRFHCARLTEFANHHFYVLPKFGPGLNLAVQDDMTKDKNTSSCFTKTAMCKRFPVL